MVAHVTLRSGRFEGKESASFLKKRSKKLLLNEGFGHAGATTPGSKSFFASFSKEEALATFLNVFLPAHSRFNGEHLNAAFDQQA
jgi:hypothetical protein